MHLAPAARAELVALQDRFSSPARDQIKVVALRCVLARWTLEMQHGPELRVLLKAVESQESVNKFAVACGRSLACQLTPGQRKRRGRA